MANSTRTQLSTDSLSLFPDNNSQLITPQDLRDWLTSGIESFVTQKDKSTFENAFYENRSTALASGATVNLSSANGNFVHITGTTNITSFGSASAGSRFILCFDGVLTLTYNATSLILPGTANITTAAGDCCLIISEGSANWRVVAYFPISGGGGGGITALTGDVTASGTGSVAATIANGAVDIPMLSATGTPSATTFLRGDNQWATPAGSGTPGGNPGEIQYNDTGAFNGVPDLTYEGSPTKFVVIKNPKIGSSNGNGHLHIHSANSAPSGITDYLTMFWQKATRVLGFRSELDTHETYIQLTAPTADRTLTLPDASGNVVIDTTVPSFSNGASAGEIRFKEAGGNDYVGIKAPSSIGTPVTWTLPNVDGTSGTVIQTNGSGVLSWVNNGGAIALQYFKETTATTITNPAANTIIQSLLIPAGTFTLNNSFVANFKTFSSNATTGVNVYLSINTTISLSGALQISGAHLLNAGIQGFNGTLGFNLYGGLSGDTTRYISSPWTNIASVGSSTVVIDWSVNQYLILWCGPSANRNITNLLIAVTPT
jgi:hypothetical protein